MAATNRLGCGYYSAVHAQGAFALTCLIVTTWCLIRVSGLTEFHNVFVQGGVVSELEVAICCLHWVVVGQTVNLPVHRLLRDQVSALWLVCGRVDVEVARHLLNLISFSLRRLITLFEKCELFLMDFDGCLNLIDIQKEVALFGPR